VLNSRKLFNSKTITITYWLSILLSTLFIQTACDQDNASGKKVRHARKHLVETYTIKIKDVVYNTTQTGTLVAKRKIKIHNQEEGLLKKLPYFEGDSVKQGDLLAKIDDTLLTAQLNKAIANREQAKQNLSRILRLHKQRIISEDQLIKAQTEYKVALADEQLLQARVSNTKILAPFNGIITLRNKEQDDVVPKFTHLMSMADPSTLIIKIQISELLIAKYKINDKVDILIDALEKHSYTGFINRIHPTIDSDTRQGTLEIRLNPIPKGAKAGQLCRVTLKTTPKPSLSIPFSALRQDKKGEFVYLVKNNQAKRINVRSGLRHGQFVDIPVGLSEHQVLITKGFLGLRPGKKVIDANAPRRKNSNGKQKHSKSDSKQIELKTKHSH